jgi:hypothetical protein
LLTHLVQEQATILVWHLLLTCAFLQYLNLNSPHVAGTAQLTLTNQHLPNTNMTCGSVINSALLMTLAPLFSVDVLPFRIRNFLSLNIDLPAGLACLPRRPYLLQSTPSSDNGHHVVSETWAMTHSWDWPMVFSPGVSIIHATILTAADQHIQYLSIDVRHEAGFGHEGGLPGASSIHQWNALSWGYMSVTAIVIIV